MTARKARRAMIELTESRPTGMPPRQQVTTFEVHSEGGGSLDHLLLRMRVIGASDDRGRTMMNMIVDKDDARALFNWLGVWLHTG